MIRSICWLLILAAVITSCVPDKKYVLFQKDTGNKKNLLTQKFCVHTLFADDLHDQVGVGSTY